MSVGLNTPAGPSVSGLLLYTAGPVGRPSSQSNQISAVGPSGPSGLGAIASASAGLPQGLSVVPVEIEEKASSSLTPHRSTRRSTPTRPLLREDDSTESGLLARSPGSRRADDRILERADWIGQLVSNATGWLGTVSLDRAGTVEEAPANTAGPSAHCRGSRYGRASARDRFVLLADRGRRRARHDRLSISSNHPRIRQSSSPTRLASKIQVHPGRTTSSGQGQGPIRGGSTRSRAGPDEKSTGRALAPFRIVASSHLCGERTEGRVNPAGTVRPLPSTTSADRRR